VFATRQLCKRQLTWLRAVRERTVIDCCDADATAQAVNAIRALLGL
jgi:tRNA dimethylallyltransferase